MPIELDANAADARMSTDERDSTASSPCSTGNARTNDDAFRDHFLAVAKETTEKYWPLPLYDEFSSTVKSGIADLCNSTGRAAAA